MVKKYFFEFEMRTKCEDDPKKVADILLKVFDFASREGLKVVGHSIVLREEANSK